MKNLIFILLVLVACNSLNDEEEKTYNFKYEIETNESITTNVTYLFKGEYLTKEITTIQDGETAYWESESQTIEDDYYAYIEIDDSHNVAGWFYFIINNEVWDYSYISNYASVTWKFAWYLDLEDDGF